MDIRLDYSMLLVVPMEYTEENYAYQKNTLIHQETAHMAQRRSKSEGDKRIGTPTSDFGSPNRCGSKIQRTDAHGSPEIWVVEVLQRNGRYEPVAAPAERPYTLEAAKQRTRELIEKYDFLKKRKYKMRIGLYRQVLVDWIEVDAS